jgi:Ran GTPase-activating protein (RanGAP) involved in mRNA processing and transport
VVPLFAGAGVSCTTGAVEEGATGADIFHQMTHRTSSSLANVRTRKDLAELINSSADPLAIKQEYVEHGGTEDMEQENDDDIQVVETYGNTHSGDDYENYECDEGLLDENEEEEGEVVCYEEEDESRHDGEPGSACPEKSDLEMDADPRAEDFARTRA